MLLEIASGGQRLTSFIITEYHTSLCDQRIRRRDQSFWIIHCHASIVDVQDGPSRIFPARLQRVDAKS
jgi:hypothetical protein